jgi:hypothetical protein
MRFILGVLELTLRLCAAYYIFYYGISKPTQFQGAKMLHSTVREASNFDMMWAFFGTTQTYPIVIGSLQVLGAMLLIFRKTKLLGALLLTPIFLNIILLDILYEVPFGALITAVLIQAVLCIVLIQERQKIVNAFKSVLLKSNLKTSKRDVTIKYLIALSITLLVMFVLDK